MVSRLILTRSQKSWSLLWQLDAKTSADQSREPKYLPSLHLQLGCVSLWVKERRLLVLRMYLDLGSSRTIGMVRQIKWWESLYEFLVVQLRHVDNNYNVDPVSALLWLELTQAALAWIAPFKLLDVERVKVTPGIMSLNGLKEGSEIDYQQACFH